MTAALPLLEMMYRTRSKITAWGVRCLAIKWLKSCLCDKAIGPDSLPAELFKTESNDLVGRLHQLNERRSYDMRQLQGTSLLPIAYKVLMGILCERMKQYVKILIRPYQCDFRPCNSIITRDLHKRPTKIKLSTSDLSVRLLLGAGIDCLVLIY